MNSKSKVQRKGKQPTNNKQGERNGQTIRLEHGRHLRPGQRIGPLNLPGLAGFFEWPDSALFKFVAEFIADNGILFPDHMPKKRGKDFLCPVAELALAEAIIIARAVINNPDAETFTFPLPGLAAHRPLTREQTMHYLASIWHEHSAVWRGMGWMPGVRFAHDQRAGDQFQFAQVHVVCETWLLRAGVLEQMDYEGHAHRAAFKHYAAALQTATYQAISSGLPELRGET